MWVEWQSIACGINKFTRNVIIEKSIAITNQSKLILSIHNIKSKYSDIFKQNPIMSNGL